MAGSDLTTDLGIAVKLFIDSIEGAKVTAADQKKAQKVQEAFADALAKSLEGKGKTAIVPVELAPEIRGSKKGKKGLGQAVNTRDFVNTVVAELEKEGAAGQSEIRQAWLNYLKTVQDSFSTVGLGALNIPRAEKLLQGYAADPKRFDQLSQSRKDRLAKVEAGLRGQLRQAQQIENLANRVNQVIRSVEEADDGTISETVQRLPPIINPAIGARRQRLEEVLTAYKSTTSKKASKARANQERLAQSDQLIIDQYAKSPTEVSDIKDVARLQTILQAVGRRLKDTQTAIRDNPAAIDDLTKQANELLQVQANAQVQLRDVSPVAQRRRDQKDLRLNDAKRLRDQFWGTDKKRTDASHKGENTYFGGYLDAYSDLINEARRRQRTATSQDEIDGARKELEDLRKEQTAIRNRKKALEGSTLGKSLKDADRERRDAETEARQYFKLFNKLSGMAGEPLTEELSRFGASPEEARQVLLQLAKRSASTAVTKASAVVTKTGDDEGDKAAAQKKVVELVQLQTRIKGAADADKEWARTADDARKSDTKRTEALTAFNNQLGVTRDLQASLSGKSFGTSDYLKEEQKLKTAMGELSRMGKALGTDSVQFGQAVDQRVEYLQLNQENRTANTAANRVARKADTRQATVDRLNAELAAAQKASETSYASFAPANAYKIAQQDGTLDSQLSEMKLLARRYGSNAGTALGLGLKDEAVQFETLGRKVANARKELEKYAAAVPATADKNKDLTNTLRKLYGEQYQLEQLDFSSKGDFNTISKRASRSAAKADKLAAELGIVREKTYSEELVALRERRQEAKAERGRIEEKKVADAKWLEGVKIESAAMESRDARLSEIRGIATALQLGDKKAAAQNLLGISKTSGMEGIEGGELALSTLQKQIGELRTEAKNNGLDEVVAELDRIKKQAESAGTALKELDRVTRSSREKVLKHAEGLRQAGKSADQQWREAQALLKQAETGFAESVGRMRESVFGTAGYKIANRDAGEFAKSIQNLRTKLLIENPKEMVDSLTRLQEAARDDKSAQAQMQSWREKFGSDNAKLLDTRGKGEAADNLTAFLTARDIATRNTQAEMSAFYRQEERSSLQARRSLNLVELRDADKNLKAEEAKRSVNALLPDFRQEVRGYQSGGIQDFFQLITANAGDPIRALAQLKQLREDIYDTRRVAKAQGLNAERKELKTLADVLSQVIKKYEEFDQAANKPAKPLPGAAAYKRQEEQRTKQLGTNLQYDIGREAYQDAGGSISRIAKEDHAAAKTYFAERLKQIDAERAAVAASNMGLKEQRRIARQLNIEAEDLTRAQNELGMVMRGNVGFMRQLSMAATAFVRYFVLYGAAYNIIGYFKNLTSTIITFQDSLKETQVIAQATREEMVGIGSAIRDVASTSGDSLQNVSQAAETLAQAGVAVQNIPAALQAVSDFALATGSSLQVAADIITSAKEIFGEDLTFGAAADQLTRTVNISKLKAEDLKTIFNLGAQTAQASGLSSAQFLGASATLSNLGIKSSTVATGVRQLLLEVFNPDEKTIAFLRKRYNELGERLTDQQIVGRFRAYQQTDNPLLSALTELRRLGAGGAAQDDFRRVLDIRAENVALPLIRRLDELARNTAQISEPGAAATGAADRVDTLSKAFDQLKVKAQLLAEALGKPVLDGLTGLTKGLGEFFDKLIEYRQRLLLSGTDSVADTSTAGAGGILGFVLGRRLGLGNLGSTAAGAAGAVASTGAVSTTEAVAGREQASTLNTILQYLGIFALFGKKGKELGDPQGVKGLLQKAQGVFEWLLKGSTWLRGIFAGGAIAGLGTIVGRIISLGSPLGWAVAGMMSLEQIFKAFRDTFKPEKLKEMAPDLEAGRARIAEEQRKVDQLSDQVKQEQGLTDDANQIKKSLDRYDEQMRRLFGAKAEQAQAILAELGNIPIESGTRQAEEIRKKLEDKVNNGQPLDNARFARLVQAQSDFTASQQSLFGKAQAILRSVADLLKKPKDKLTKTEEKFLATYQALQGSPLFKPDAFRPGDLAQAVQDYFRLISDQTNLVTEQYRNARAALSGQNYALGGLRQEVRSGYSTPGDNNIRQSLQAQVARIRQNPTTEGQQVLDDFRSALNEIVNDLQNPNSDTRRALNDAQAAQLLNEIQAQIQALGGEMQTNTGTMDTRERQAEEQRKADTARQEDIDRRRAELAEEAEKAERRYIELTTQRNKGLELVNELDGKIKVAKEKEEWGALLGPGGLLERRYKAELDVLKADEELAAAKLRLAAQGQGVTLPKGVGDLTTDQIQSLTQDPDTRSLYEQFVEKQRKVREAPKSYASERELAERASRKKIEFYPDDAFTARQNEINRINEELGDQVRESQDQLREKYDRLFELEDKNLEVQIQHLQDEEWKYDTPTEQARFRVEMNELTQRREKLRREMANKRDQEVARLDEAESKAQARVIEERIRALEEERDQISQSPTTTRRAAQEIAGVPPGVAPMGLPSGSGVAPNGPMIRRIGDREVSVRPTTGSRGERTNVEGVDQEFMDALVTAAQYTENKVQIISGKNSRSTGTPNHPAGDALDVQLTTPSGDVLQNIAHGPRDRKGIKDFREYEKFWQLVKAVMATKYPGKPFRYGGYFKAYMDSMHGDVHSNAMGYGSWERGANDEMRRRYPGLVSEGMGDIAAFAARMEGLTAPAGNYRAPGQGAGVAPSIPTLTTQGSQRLAAIAAELAELRRQLLEKNRNVNNYGKSPQEIEDQNREEIERYRRGIYEDIIKGGEQQIDLSRNIISSTQQQTQTAESLLRGSTPMEGAAREAAGMGFSPEQELEYLRRIAETLEATVSATNDALTKAQDLLDAAVEERDGLVEEMANYDPDSDVYKDAEKRLKAIEVLIEKRTAAVGEFGQADNEAVARLVKNRQDRQQFDPTLFGKVEQVPITDRQGNQVYNKDGSPRTTEVKTYGQLDQAFDIEAIAGQLNELPYALKNLGKNIRSFIVGAVDTFVSTIADRLVKGAAEVDTTALNEARANLYQAQAESTTEAARLQSELRDAQSSGLDTPEARARKAELQTAYAQSSQNRAAEINARQAQVNELEQQAQGPTLGDTFTGLAQEFSTEMLKTVLLAPFQGILNSITGKRDGSDASPFSVMVKNWPSGLGKTGEAVPGAPGTPGAEGSGSAMGQLEDFIYKIGDEFSSVFDSVIGWIGKIFSSGGSGGGAGWVSSILSLVGGFAGFAEGGQVRTGHVKGPGTGTSDSIPAWLSNGEYVLTAAEVQKIGVQNIEKWKAAMASPAKFATGGLVQSFDATRRNLANSSNAGATGGSTDVTIIDQRSQASSEPVEVSRTRGPDNKEIIQVMVRDAVKTAINSGMLDRTMAANYGARRAGGRR